MEPFSIHNVLFQNKYNKLQNDGRKPIMSATKSFEPPHHQAGGLGPKPNNCGAKSNTHNVAGNENVSTLRNWSSDPMCAAVIRWQGGDHHHHQYCNFLLPIMPPPPPPPALVRKYRAEQNCAQPSSHHYRHSVQDRTSITHSITHSITVLKYYRHSVQDRTSITHNITHSITVLKYYRHSVRDRTSMSLFREQQQAGGSIIIFRVRHQPLLWTLTCHFSLSF